eukprot:6025908-Prymnesium_polylepis.2
MHNREATELVMNAIENPNHTMCKSLRKNASSLGHAETLQDASVRLNQAPSFRMDVYVTTQDSSSSFWNIVWVHVQVHAQDLSEERTLSGSH